MGLSSTSKKVFPTKENITHERVESLLFSTLENSMKSNSQTVKMGIELEFFLMHKNGKTVGMNESQEFMLSVSRLPGWKLFAESGMEGRTSKVSFEVLGIGYHSLKYEHPPHMLEIAFAPYGNLHELYESILKVWADFGEAAAQVGIDLVFKHKIEAPELNWNEISKFSSKYVALAVTREKAVSPSQKNEQWVHFTTYTAATQFHIGGTRWWKEDGKFVERLYRAELLASINAFELLGVKPNAIKDSFFNRWSGYFRVFRELALVGFPKFDHWSIQKWVENFCKSSLVMVESDPFFGKDLESIADVLSDGELNRAIQTVRDLQIVRPKLFGTLEFRADPALPTPETIIRQAALRFGIYHHCLNSKSEPLAGVSFTEIGNRWREGLNAKGLEAELETLREDAFRALLVRGLGEEGLL
jgi:hypothetical protein